MELLINVVYSFISAIIVFGFMYLAKLLVDVRVKKIYNADIEIEEENNFAVALRRAGLYIGIAIAMFGAIKGSFFLQIIDGFIILSFMMISMTISEHIIFPKINNLEALKNKNIAVGIIEFSLYVATGIIAFASFEGHGPWYASIVFFILGQILLVAMTRIYEILHPNILKNIQENSIASGILLGGIIIAYSMLLKAAVEGPFTSWTDDLIAFSISAILGLIMLLILANKAVDRLFLTGSNIKKELEEENPAALFVVVSVKIAIAYVISGVVL